MNGLSLYLMIVYHIGVHNVVDIDRLMRLWRPAPRGCHRCSLGSAVKSSSRRGLMLEAGMEARLEAIVCLTSMVGVIRVMVR